MIRRVGCWTLLALVLWAPPAAVADEEAFDPLMEAMVEWIAVGKDTLRIEDAPAPHRIVTALADVRGHSVRAAFGAVLWDRPVRQRPGRVEVVVGDDTLDSSRFTDSRASRWNRQNSEPRQGISSAVEQDGFALSRDLWVSLDASYKRAVQRIRAKRAARDARANDERPGDWSAAPPVVRIDTTPLAEVPADALRSLALEASASLAKLDGLDVGEVTANAIELRYYLATSEGTRLVQAEGFVAVHAAVETLRDDGVSIEDEVQWVVRRFEDLPPRETLLGEVAAAGRNVLARAAAESVDYYEGPVIFEGRAAAQFFRFLVPPEIMGTPPAPETGRSYQGQMRRAARPGRRLLPAGWSVEDDPTRELPGLAGGYAFDREGVAGQAVRLVEDGYVRDLLMTRVPRLDRTESNGHARGSINESWSARPSLWRVVPGRNLSDRAFDREVRRAREASRLDRVLVVRRFGRDRPGRLPVPAEAVWRDADGGEVPVDLLAFENIDRRALRNVAAAGGGETTLAYLAPWEPRGYPGRDTGIPTVVTAPARLLVEDLELAFPGASDKPHTYPRPTSGATASRESMNR